MPRRPPLGAQFTCFTSTKVQILTPEELLLDNLIFKRQSPECLAVLDWELSTIGDPIADLAYNCLVYYLPPTFPQAGAGLWGGGLPCLRACR
jgi:aminoglycoside phosphotransferase (APT) family kinase protein